MIAIITLQETIMISFVIIFLTGIALGVPLGWLLVMKYQKPRQDALRQSRLLWHNEAKRLSGQPPYSGGLIMHGPFPKPSPIPIDDLSAVLDNG